jgi:hypothetical protein
MAVADLAPVAVGVIVKPSMQLDVGPKGRRRAKREVTPIRPSQRNAANG